MSAEQIMPILPGEPYARKLHGQQVHIRALHDKLAAAGTATATAQLRAARAEQTIRNLQLEIDRLRRRAETAEAALASIGDRT